MTDEQFKHLTCELDRVVKLLALLVSGASGELNNDKGRRMAADAVSRIFADK